MIDKIIHTTYLDIVSIISFIGIPIILGKFSKIFKRESIATI